MTQQEKAKAYDEALERAKAAIRECGDNQGRIKMIKSIFHELKESEDERMLRKLIDHFDWHNSSRLTHEECDEILSWLEKQKEQKPLPQDYSEAFDDFMSHIPEKDPESSTSLYTYEDMMSAIQFGIKWKGEQQPSEWKPSKGQMSALDIALECVYTEEDSEELKSLYSDLQKLL